MGKGRRTGGSYLEVDAEDLLFARLGHVGRWLWSLCRVESCSTVPIPDVSLSAWTNPLYVTLRLRACAMTHRRARTRSVRLNTDTDRGGGVYSVYNTIRLITISCPSVCCCRAALVLLMNNGGVSRSAVRNQSRCSLWTRSCPIQLQLQPQLASGQNKHVAKTVFILHARALIQLLDVDVRIACPALRCIMGNVVHTM